MMSSLNRKRFTYLSGPWPDVAIRSWLKGSSGRILGSWTNRHFTRPLNPIPSEVLEGTGSGGFIEYVGHVSSGFGESEHKTEVAFVQFCWFEIFLSSTLLSNLPVRGLAGSNFCTRLDESSYLGHSVVLAFAVLLIAALSQVLEFAWAYVVM